MAVQAFPMGLPATITQLLAELEREQEERRRRLEAGQSVQPLLCLNREAALLMHILLKASGARRVLEIGTSAGYSGLWILSALPADGQLVTIEREPEKIALASRTFSRAGFAERVQIIRGEALAVLPRLTGPFDAAFLDAAKGEYIAYFEAAARLLRPGGLVIADNLTSHRAELEPFIQHVHNRPDFLSVTVPIGNGLEVSLKR
ncbi:MAG TPA: O-methyltransferase [Bacillota bacterium]